MKREIGLSSILSLLILVFRLSGASNIVQYEPEVDLDLYESFELSRKPKFGQKNRHDCELEHSDSLFGDTDFNNDYNEVSYQCGKNRGSKKDLLRREVNRLVGDMDYRKDRRGYSKKQIEDNYFSFRGAEEHSPDDLDFEGLFEKNYGGRGRVVEIHKVVPKEFDYDDLNLKRYDYAAGATARDRRFGKYKKGDDKIVLIITPKNFFADKNGEISLLPSLALKISRNSKLSSLIKMIKKIVKDAYPNIDIYRIRHLESRIILNEAPQNVKISSLKIKNGNEISVTFKEIPNDDALDSEYGTSKKILANELPLTPEEANTAELPELVIDTDPDKNKESMANIIHELEAEPNLYISDKNDLILGSNSSEAFDDDLFVVEYNFGDMIDEPKFDYNMDVDSNNTLVGDLHSDMLSGTRPEDRKFSVSDEEVDFIDQERAIEAEKNTNEDLDVTSSDAEYNSCNYRVNFKQIPTTYLNSTNEVEKIPPRDISIQNITFNELEPCKLETLVSEINQVLDSMDETYYLVGLEHKPSNRELLGLLKNNDIHHLLDLEIMKDDEFNALLMSLSELKDSSTASNADKKGDHIIITVGSNEEKLPKDKCQVRVTIFVYSILEHRVVGRIKLGKSMEDQEIMASKRHLKPVNVCTSSNTPISLILERVKHFLRIDQRSNCIFICGEKIVDSSSNLAVARIESETCVLRYDA
ncbi:putative signal peptide protein [Cryptosporidium canis]|uniref:Signal peptide protein n=1 Tax=Cryptosporidium canis TaxID=195482 RepID=A0A9D5HXG1_9CRYT|nr:putative signal peptide protein [Cryptosporidium canis]